MREIIRYGFILSFICVISSSLLAGINSLTQPKILTQQKAQEELGLRELFPEALQFKPVESAGNIIYYKVYNKANEFLAVAFKAQAKGYSSDIETLVGMAKEGNVLNIKIINQNETPGLGSRIIEASFTGRFSNKEINQLNAVEAITGATISSKSVIDSVQNKSEEILRLIKNEK